MTHAILPLPALAAVAAGAAGGGTTGADTTAAYATATATDATATATATDATATARPTAATVAVPAPSAAALRYYHSGNVLWGVDNLLALVLPALWLWSGLAARLRTAVSRPGRSWPATLALFFAAYVAINFVVTLPLTWYEDFVREHAYGLSNQTFGRWLGDALKLLAVAIVGGALTVWIPYLLLRRSPRRWWLWSAVASVPVLVLVLLVEPLWVEPLFNRIGPMHDRGLESAIVDLATRCGVTGEHVFEVDKSADTNATNAYVTGVLGTKRVVVWDTIIRLLDRRALLFAVGHELGHYVLNHLPTGIAFFAALIAVGLGLVHLTSRRLLATAAPRFGFDRLDDVASLPLLALLLGAFFLVMSPLALAFSRHLEHEADRFGLELTEDNAACGRAFVGLQSTNLGVPRPGLFYKLWRADHPPLGERIDFCNSYRPWETGAPERYGHLFRPAAAAPGR
jgi:STE24 endopeptidase